MTWVMRRGQIKHLLYEHCLNGRIDKSLFTEQLADLNSVTPVVRCKDCKHRPIPNGNNHPLTPKPSEFEWDETCPYVCADEWHNEMPDDNDFCSKGERKDSDETIHGSGQDGI